jgi:hypothetical protein
MAGGEVLTIIGAWLRADSVVGWSQGRRMTLASSDITKVEHEVVDGVKTGVALGSLAAVAGGMFALGHSDGFFSSYSSDAGRPKRDRVCRGGQANMRRLPCTHPGFREAKTLAPQFD